MNDSSIKAPVASAALASAPVVNLTSVMEFQATLLSHSSFSEAAAALATDLAVKLGFERVAIGLLENGYTKIVALSHDVKLGADSDLSRVLLPAMDEAIEQSTTIKYPESLDDVPKVILAHAALARFSEGQVFTVPFISDKQIFGAITFERNRSNLITTDEITACEQVSHFIGPIFQLKHLANQPLHIKLKEKLAAWFKQQKASSKQGTRLALYAASLALLGLLFIPVEHRVSAPARLEGLVQRALVATEDGYLQQSYVRPGDQVKANQVLAELADKELLLEQQKWQSELTQYENAYGTALAGSDRVQMMLNQAKMDGAKSQLQLVEQKILRAKIVAPFDGVIIKGDLKQSLGAPVQMGDVLLTISPVGEFRIIIDVDERDIAQISPSQEGVVAFVSLPDHKLEFSVKSITPVATSKEGRNYFEVEALLNKPYKELSLHPGLDGVAKIKTVKQPFIWIWTHRIVDWFKITLWSWGL